MSFFRALYVQGEYTRKGCLGISKVVVLSFVLIL